MKNNLLPSNCSMNPNNIQCSEITNGKYSKLEEVDGSTARTLRK